MRTIIGLRPAPQRRISQRSGLRLTPVGPRAVAAGSTVTYRLRLRNLRRGPRNRLVASLWHLTATGSAFAIPVGGSLKARRELVRSRWRVAELRAKHSRTLSLRVQVPVSSAARVCVAADATADSARPARAVVCARVSSPPSPPPSPPHIGGLG
jgi:hypothetical protein